MAKRKAQVDRQSCVACGCCVKVCPKDAVSVFRGMYAWVDETKCIGCGKCAKACPADVIQMIQLEVAV
jgi:formate hydrogenlyase subunit 6/NADH:ubiquinone oxidoreductase subunit I